MSKHLYFKQFSLAYKNYSISDNSFSLKYPISMSKTFVRGAYDRFLDFFRMGI